MSDKKIIESTLYPTLSPMFSPLSQEILSATKHFRRERERDYLRAAGSESKEDRERTNTFIGIQSWYTPDVAEIRRGCVQTILHDSPFPHISSQRNCGT